MVFGLLPWYTRQILQAGFLGSWWGLSFLQITVIVALTSPVELLDLKSFQKETIPQKSHLQLSENLAGEYIRAMHDKALSDTDGHILLLSWIYLNRWGMIVQSKHSRTPLLFGLFSAYQVFGAIFWWVTPLFAHTCTYA